MGRTDNGNLNHQAEASDTCEGLPFLICERPSEDDEEKGPNRLVKSPAMVSERPIHLRQRVVNAT